MLRVLIQNRAGPILMIAFTNHALDHMLRSVLDAKITQKIVRLGSRSADERIAEFSLENMENVAGRSRLSSAFSNYRWALRDVEKEIKDFMESFFREDVDTDDLLQYLTFQAPALADSIQYPPEWVMALYELQRTEKDGTWHTAGRTKPGRLDPDDDSLYGFWVRGGDVEFLHSTHRALHYRPPPLPSQLVRPQQQPPRPANAFELLAVEAADVTTAEQNTGDDGKDAGGSEAEDDNDDYSDVELEPEEAWITAEISDDSDDFSLATDSEDEVHEPPAPVPPPPATTTPVAPQAPASAATGQWQTPASIQANDFTNIRGFFVAFGCADIPTVPTTARPVVELLALDNAWSMSVSERQQLHRVWADEVRITSRETQLMEFRRLREKHAQASRDYAEGQAEVSCYKRTIVSEV